MAAPRHAQRHTRAPAEPDCDLELTCDAQRSNAPTDEAECNVKPPRSALGRQVAALAEGQKGLVSHRQLIAVGLTRGAIAHGVRRGWLHPRHRGVYAVGHAKLPPLGEEMAAVLALGDRALVSHASAAEALGIHR